ncbi:glycine-rich domain-containing protein [Streptomyces sp. KMM 9044]|uniref:glycine-rich domain-containing protein n=1 Tax=Streptomyces sp. KMM 9044 TaxID=2744474 RepID=UPI0021506E8D|nr:hypothetical protein [Streptomyces sp. KMM 9044]WAX78883.1 hypothetical protein HUV60_015495 [Streptomyces sp. KMM 9044]
MATAADTPVATDPVTGPARSPRDIVPAGLWEKQVGLLMRDYPYDSVMATRVLGQGYAYLLTAMSLRGQGLGLAPSKLVDIGAHTIILDTVAYAELCDKYNGGHFLHHVPKVETKNDGSVIKTAHLVARAGWEVDLPLWEDAADCGPCHPGNDSH